jgi:hypothetical protein
LVLVPVLELVTALQVPLARVVASPCVPVATQAVEEAHEIPVRSYVVPVDCAVVAADVPEASKEYPAPPVPTVKQAVDAGHETARSPGTGSVYLVVHVEDTSFTTVPPSVLTKQVPATGQLTRQKVAVVPVDAPVCWVHVPLASVTPTPSVPTATHAVVDQQDTPRKSEVVFIVWLVTVVADPEASNV